MAHYGVPQFMSWHGDSIYWAGIANGHAAWVEKITCPK
jgi:hypothetical protein